jgi:hypothetical protein
MLSHGGAGAQGRTLRLWAFDDRQRATREGGHEADGRQQPYAEAQREHHDKEQAR